MASMMTIGVVVLDRYAKYDQFDPLNEKLDLFHEECAGGRVAMEQTETGSVVFKCTACGWDSGSYKGVFIRRSLRSLLISREPINWDGFRVNPISPPPAVRICPTCRSPVDVDKDEYAVFHRPKKPSAYLHTACAPAEIDEQKGPARRSLDDLLQELQDLARRQAEPVPTRVAK